VTKRREGEGVYDDERIPRGVQVERRSDGTTVYDVSPNQEGTLEVPLGEGRIDIEIPPNPTIRVLDGREVPQLEAPLVLVQFEVVAQDWRRGWCPVGGEHYEREYISDPTEPDLVLDQLDGFVSIWAYQGERIDIERTGTFPLYVTVRKHDTG
jgi:hypothetical protein